MNINDIETHKNTRNKKTVLNETVSKYSPTSLTLSYQERQYHQYLKEILQKSKEKKWTKQNLTCKSKQKNKNRKEMNKNKTKYVKVNKNNRTKTKEKTYESRRMYKSKTTT